MADGLGMPNGLSFSPDEQALYITDTDAVHGEGVYSPHKPASKYVPTFSEAYGADIQVKDMLTAS
jgi:gluconolactonase